MTEARGSLDSRGSRPSWIIETGRTIGKVGVKGRRREKKERGRESRRSR